MAENMINLNLTHLTHPWSPPRWFDALNSLPVVIFENGQNDHFQACRKGPKFATGSEFNASNHQGGPQGWVRWVKTKSIIFKSFSAMIFKIGPFFSIWKHYLPTMVSVVQGVKFLYHWLLLHFKSNTLNGFGKWGYHVLIHQICLASPNMFFSCVMVSASGLL